MPARIYPDPSDPWVALTKPIEYDLLKYGATMMQMSFEVEQRRVPRCKCHNQLMQWYSNSRAKYGGEFRCPIKRRESQRAYNQRRYRNNQIYRTTDIIRRRRKHREDAIVMGEQMLDQLKATRGEI